MSRDAQSVAEIEIVVNGEQKTVRAGATLVELLPSLGAPREGFAVERNGKIVPRSLHATEQLAAGDRLEIVTFVGGG
ncbi:MAG: sulfur carrier protein ThiS [Planctomycetota bacterium]